MARVADWFGGTHSISSEWIDYYKEKYSRLRVEVKESMEAHDNEKARTTLVEMQEIGDDWWGNLRERNLATIAGGKRGVTTLEFTHTASKVTLVVGMGPALGPVLGGSGLVVEFAGSVLVGSSAQGVENILVQLSEVSAGERDVFDPKEILEKFGHDVGTGLVIKMIGGGLEK